MSELPSNGRDPKSLVFLAAGTTNGTAHGVAYNQGDFVFPQEMERHRASEQDAQVAHITRWTALQIRTTTLVWLRRFQMPTPPSNLNHYE